MTTTIYKYAIFCVTESLWKYVWAAEGDPVPDKCPTNTAHEIDSESIHVEDSVKQEQVEAEIIEQPPGVTQGHYQSSFFQLSVPALSGLHTMDISFPFGISLLCGEYHMPAAGAGDQIWADIAPDTIIGGISQDVAIGATKFRTSAESLAYLQIGFVVKLFDGVNQNNLGRVLALDAVNLEVTMEIATTHPFAAASPTYIQITVQCVRTANISASILSIEFGKRNIKSTFLPANTVLRCTYNNITSTAKIVDFRIEYFY